MNVVMKNLSLFKDEARFCTVARGFGNESARSGFVRSANEDVVVIEVFRDFDAEGISIVRTKDVTEVSSDLRDVFFGDVIVAEGLRMPTNTSLEFESLYSAARWSSSTGNLISVAIEPHVGDDVRFWIGRVQLYTDDEILLRLVRSVGTWDPDVEKIQLAEVTQIGMLSPYLRYFQKYVTEPV